MTEINIDIAKIRENGIFLMLPAYGGQCFAAFAQSLLRLGMVCTQYQIPFDLCLISNESLVQRARNYCADTFLRAQFQQAQPDGTVATKHFQHGLFIDSDIEFNPMDVLVLAHLQNTNDAYDVVCGPYPKKTIAWEKIKQVVDKGLVDDDPKLLENYVGDFVFNLPDGVTSAPLSAPFQVMEAGTGFMMFRRDTLLRVAVANPQISYLPDHTRSEGFDGSRTISAFFDCIIDPDSKRYLSEDYYFCRLVNKAGMQVWMVPWYELKHHGYFVYGGSLGHMAAAGVSATADPTQLKRKKKGK
jgi:hypothetical protein